MGIFAAAGEGVTTGRDMLILLKNLTGRSRSSLDGAIKLVTADDILLEGGKIPNTAFSKQVGLSVDVFELQHFSDVCGLSQITPATVFAKGGTTKGGHSAYLIWTPDFQTGAMIMANRAGAFSGQPITCLAIRVIHTLISNQ